MELTHFAENKFFSRSRVSLDARTHQSVLKKDPNIEQLGQKVP
jgi:hypothetical protein